MTGAGTDTTPVAVDGFCGAGGLSLGLARAGFRVGAAFDVNPHAVATYRRNLGGHVRQACVREMDFDRVAGVAGTADIALVAGGPPCQGFSVQRRDGGGDSRNSLPFAFLDLVRAARPAFFLFENVAGIRGRHGRAVLDEFLAAAEAAGYHCHAQVIDAADYGVPQFRKRLFVVGEWSPDGRTWFQFPTPDPAPRPTVRAAFAGLPEPPADGTPDPAVPNHRRTRLSSLNVERIRRVPPGGGMQDLPAELRVACHRAGPAKIGHRFVYGRLHYDEPAATITARFDSFTRGKFGHPASDRSITLREGARLQTFPDDFVFEGGQEDIAAQIGNAVPPRLAETLGLAVLAALTARRVGSPAGRARQGLLF